MSIAALVILADRVQGVVRSSQPWGAAPPRWHEVPWRAGEAPDAAVAAIRGALGPVRRVHLVIGLAHLQVQQLALPPASSADRRQMVALDPARWFALPSDAAAAVALAPGDTMAFATDAAWLEQWATAASAWGPVAGVDAAPVALARALDAAGVPDGTTEIEAGAGEAGRLERRARALPLVRRVPAAMASPAEPLPATVGPAPADIATGWGAMLAPLDDQTTALLTPTIARQLARAARRRWITAAVAAAAGVLVLLQAVGASRERRLAWLEGEVAAQRAAAAPALQQVTDAARLDREQAIIAASAGTRAPMLAPLARLAERLPAGAVTQRVHVVGREWRIEGSAPTAAAVLEALAADSTFAEVRLLGPSARMAGSATPRETYAIGFVVR